VYGNDCDLIIFNQHKFGFTLQEWQFDQQKCGFTPQKKYFVEVTTSWIYTSRMDKHGNSTKTG
jgi:hypothetical protein